MDLEKRVEKLERENRRLKLVLGLPLLLGLAGVLTGFGGQQSQFLSVRELRIVDENGDTRIRLGATPEALNYEGERFTELVPGRLELTAGSGNGTVFLGSTGLTFHNSSSSVLEDAQSFLRESAKLDRGPSAYFGHFGVIARDSNAAISLLDAVFMRYCEQQWNAPKRRRPYEAGLETAASRNSDPRPLGPVVRDVRGGFGDAGWLSRHGPQPWRSSVVDPRGSARLYRMVRVSGLADQPR